MTSEVRAHPLARFARAGFQDLSEAQEGLNELAERVEMPMPELLEAFQFAADPDTALIRLSALADAHPGSLSTLEQIEWERLALLIGASPALGDFFARRPGRLRQILQRGGRLIEAHEARAELLAAVGASGEARTPVAEKADEGTWVDLRSRYRELLAELMLYDLSRGREGQAADAFDSVSASLSDLAAAALDAALAVARTAVITGLSGPETPADHVLATRLGIVAMGKCGARELNVVSDVDVLFIAEAAAVSSVPAEPSLPAESSELAEPSEPSESREPAEQPVPAEQPAPQILPASGSRPEESDGPGTSASRDSSDEQGSSRGQDDATIISTELAVRIATRLASEVMRVIHDPAFEPPLWQVDANLRPEGRHGSLVRTLGSMMSYYERWAKTWEFQALLKARPVAGDLDLGQDFVDRTRLMVWESGSRDDFVGSVQRMRERVTEHIANDELDVQLKLGPGGLRDVEFSVQLLQLVHGQYDDRLHDRGTMPALDALVSDGYVARGDGERLASAYRRLRVLEHRLQLRDLRRTAVMPTDEDQLRVLARASQLAPNGKELMILWRGIKREVRELHLKIFYAPLLSAVAALPDEELVLGGDEARARLHSIGFRDPDGAIRHLSALTKGTSRTARIQRNLLPVLLQWLAEGTDPDYGLLAFRRVSEANLENPWYLRLLRDGNEAAERLTRVLSNSKFAAELLETVPEAVAWLERDELLRPVPLEALLEEMRALASRRGSLEAAAEALRTVHKREVLRLALGRLVFVNDEADIAAGLDAAHTALLDGLLLAIRAAGRDAAPGGPSGAITAGTPPIELALIGMGRYGGRELVFASDVDLLAVYRVSAEASPEHAAAATRAASRLVSELRRLVSDVKFAIDLDFDLRPEGKNGPLVRSLDAYRAYYERWSLTWEAQALLRARPVAGDAALGADFISLADRIRFPQVFTDANTRDVRRIKARVEAERLPRGTDPRRHLKLGPGGISDVEWLVQLLQLQYGSGHVALRTQSTEAGLHGAVEAGVLKESDRVQLEAAWALASRLRSASKLWSGRVDDTLPVERAALEGIAGVLGLPPGKTNDLEEQWFAVSRRARAVFEREFFGYSDHPETYPLILPS